MSDIVTRAKAALEGTTPGPWDMRYPFSIRCGLGGIRQQDAEFIVAVSSCPSWSPRCSGYGRRAQRSARSTKASDEFPETRDA